MKTNFKNLAASIELKTIIIGVCALVLVTILYQSMVTIPREQMRAEAAAERAAALHAERNEIKREVKYRACVIEAYENYSTRWDETCKSMGRAADCTLPLITANGYDETHQDAKSDCLALYK